MNNQYCKVGAVTPITSVSQAASVLEIMHNDFMEKAASVAAKENQLDEFFKRKAQSIKKILESL
ncbi:hypothetical protein [Flagellimonas crocea]|uniref:hypothetical protein n=1 Tax=Flagellimonas crocea TaxID=3067311 RepID=UPI0029700297|nr:hypothetical protein [Muricauda sp. DH64]